MKYVFGIVVVICMAYLSFKSGLFDVFLSDVESHSEVILSSEREAPQSVKPSLDATQLDIERLTHQVEQLQRTVDELETYSIKKAQESGMNDIFQAEVESQNNSTIADTNTIMSSQSQITDTKEARAVSDVINQENHDKFNQSTALVQKRVEQQAMLREIAEQRSLASIMSL